MAKLKQDKVTWIVCRVDRDGAEKPVGQFDGGDDHKRALQFARENRRLWGLEYGATIRVHRRPEK